MPKAAPQKPEDGRASIQIPPDVLTILKVRAKQMARSTNAEISYRLQQSITAEDRREAKKG